MNNLIIDNYVIFNKNPCFCCGLSILMTDKYLSRLHLHLFIMEPEKTTKRFLAYWIITYGFIRIFVCNSNENLVKISYLLEMIFFEYESYISNNLIKKDIRLMTYMCLLLIFFIY